MKWERREGGREKKAEGEKEREEGKRKKEEGKEVGRSEPWVTDKSDRAYSNH